MAGVAAPVVYRYVSLHCVIYLLAFAQGHNGIADCPHRRHLSHLAASLMRPSVAAAFLSSSNATSRVRGFSASSAADARQRRVGNGLLKNRTQSRAFQSDARGGQKKPPSFAFAFELVSPPPSTNPTR